MTGRCAAIAVAAITLAGCGSEGQGRHDVGRPAATQPLLRVTRLEGTVVRMGSLQRPKEPLLGVRLRATVCARSPAHADRTYPVSFRIAHHVLARRTATRWGKPFRIMENELHWLVPLGETTAGACRAVVEFEDVIPPSNYGGVESPLGCLGYCRNSRCYGIQLTLRADLIGGRRPAMSAASRRTIVQCGRFRRPA